LPASGSGSGFPDTCFLNAAALLHLAVSKVPLITTTPRDSPHNPTQFIAQDRLARALIVFAHAAACIALLVAPFRMSAGLRASMLVLAAIAVVIAYVRSGNARHLRVSSSLVVTATLIWITYVGIWVVFSPNWLHSLESWRGDVLTPVLAAWLFYVLTRTTADTARFSAVLLIGLVVLAAMVVLDPFQPQNLEHQPQYGTVGLVSTWFITLAPLVPLAWIAPEPWRAAARWLSGIAVIALLTGAWFSGNRMVWICFAVMLLLGAAITVFASRRFAVTAPRKNYFPRIVIAMAALGIFTAGFTASSIYRTEIHMGPNESPVEFMRHDNRKPIWREAFQMIGEKPFIGHGFHATELGDAFSARFTDPWFRQWVRQAHNFVLNYALQVGVIGAGVLVMLFGALAMAFLKLTVSASPVARLAATCGVALVAGVFLRNMVDDFFNRHTILLFGALIGMLLGLATHQHRASILPGKSGGKL
jgi:O-antigen ligase